MLTNYQLLKKVLYISYDGLTDPLGQSQILPYVQGLAKEGYQFTILSFEKRDRFLKGHKHIERLVSEFGILWVPCFFTRRPPLLSKLYDALRMRRQAVKLHQRIGFDMVHCRSYIASDVGLMMKKRFGIKFLFDMRGFWADEKKDGGSWDLRNPIFKKVYKYYKNKEAQYLEHADSIVSLTKAAKNEMSTWQIFRPKVPVTVIPCCADMQLFSLTDDAQKRMGREQLQLPQQALVLSYLGSVGTWYMLNEMLLFFKQLRAVYPNSVFLFVTPSPASLILKEAQALNINSQDLRVMEAARHEVPTFIKSSDLNISFIRPVYSKISSSPTKLGEVLSMGIPVICNSGIGDVEQIMEQANAGFVLTDFTASSFAKAIQAIPSLLAKEPFAIREGVKDIYSLSKGIEQYVSAYKDVFSDGV